MKQSEMPEQQFGARAQAYLQSTVHSQGKDLEEISHSAGRRSPGLHALDLGCGAGHVAFAMAGAGLSVSALDPSEGMLEVVKQTAEQRGYARFSTHLGQAENLPFDDGSFEWVISRFSAHHWNNVPKGMQEASRVLKDGGEIWIVDAMADENPLYDTTLQTVEMLRDPSHVRNYRQSEWTTMLNAAGFQVVDSTAWTLRMEFASWTTRMNTPELRCRAIECVWARSSEEVRQHFDVLADGSFLLPVGLIKAIKAVTA
ncbi:class I SAM-dependent methyltransferase [Limnobacter litoralis]|uniref:SAM-dependent methyltransferase n=1 Tax=Limnobacter litoralis TaxID=481366 RepID=A0ABQ5YRT1_9BURK|nr:class I SAM-dependent methyltransferase [Limnobacter litoralis]GLR25991.1 SAM-dependent methyltransferase [Limnobacter litoralis]